MLVLRRCLLVSVIRLFIDASPPTMFVSIGYTFVIDASPPTMFVSIVIRFLSMPVLGQCLLVSVIRFFIDASPPTMFVSIGYTFLYRCQSSDDVC